jgi:hypothetical protein
MGKRNVPAPCLSLCNKIFCKINLSGQPGRHRLRDNPEMRFKYPQSILFMVRLISRLIKLVYSNFAIYQAKLASDTPLAIQQYSNNSPKSVSICSYLPVFISFVINRNRDDLAALPNGQWTGSPSQEHRSAGNSVGRGSATRRKQ